MKTQSVSLGILATPNKRIPPFPDRSFFAYLCTAGQKIGMNVFVFLPTDVDFENKFVMGFKYMNRNWEKAYYPLPSLIYDRCSHRKKYRSEIQKLKSTPSITFLGHVLPDKWKNHRNLVQNPGLLPYIPPTQIVDSMQTVEEWLNVYDSVVIKPIQNSLGIGVMKISYEDHFYSVQGRDYKNRIIFKEFSDRPILFSWLKNNIKSTTLIQPYLSLSTNEGIPFDIRVLVQKGGDGKWKETGRAVRAGIINGVTSNLSGGGKAYAVHEFLPKYFDMELVNNINETISFITRELPPFIENRHGRLVELGIDIGVDKNGEVWIIEINSKPGRDSFRRIEKGTLYNQVRLSPLKYAYYLSHQLVGVKE